MNRAKQRLTGALPAIAVFLCATICCAQDPQTITLERTVSLALSNSRDLTLERAKVASAESVAQVDRASFQPSLYTGSGAAYTRGLPVAINGQPPTLFQAAYSQTIYDAPLRGQIRAEEDQAERQRTELAQTRDTVIVTTATSYLELAKIGDALELLQNELASAREILDFTQKRAENGMELPIEVTRSELAVAKIEQRIVQLRGRSQILTTQLANLTGLPTEAFEKVSAEQLPQTDHPASSLEYMAVENSPLLKVSETEQNAREETLKGARRSYQPTVALIAQYNLLSKANGYDQFFKDFNRNNVSVELLIRVPIFDSKSRAQTTLARNRLTEAQATVGIIRNDEQIAADQEISKLAEQDAALEVAKLEQKLERENLALVQTRFDVGDVSLKVFDQERVDEKEKEVALLDANFAYQQAQLAVMKMTGQLSDVFK